MKTIKLFISFFLVVSFSISIFGQKCAIDSLSKNSKWMISFLISGNYTYRYIHNTTPDNDIHLPPAWSYNSNDQISKYGFHTCILVSRKITANIYFQTGLFLDKKGYKSKIFKDSFNYGSMFGPLQYDVYDAKLDFNFVNLGVPLFINFNKKIYKKMYFETTFGICINFIQRIKIDYQGGPADRNSAYFTGGRINQWQYMLYYKLGILFKFKESACLSLSPIYSYDTTPRHDFETIDGKNKALNLYSIGVELGVHFCVDKK